MATQEATKKGMKTITLGDREIPLKKDNTPNLVFLTKEEKVVVKEFVAEMKKSKLDINLTQLKEKMKLAASSLN